MFCGVRIFLCKCAVCRYPFLPRRFFEHNAHTLMICLCLFATISCWTTLLYIRLFWSDLIWYIFAAGPIHSLLVVVYWMCAIFQRSQYIHMFLFFHAELHCPSKYQFYNCKERRSCWIRTRCVYRVDSATKCKFVVYYCHLQIGLSRIRRTKSLIEIEKEKTRKTIRVGTFLLWNGW